MNLSNIIIIGLASFFLTFLLKYLDGPFFIFTNFRRYATDTLKLYGLFGCFWCMGFWVSLLVFILWFFIPVIVYFLAVVGLLGFMHEAIADG